MSNGRNTNVLRSIATLDALLVFSLILVTTSCGHNKTALHVHTQFHSARKSGDQQHAWSLLTAFQQRQIRAEHIRPTPKQMSADTISYATKLGTTSGELSFKLQDGAWCITSPLPTYRRQDSPKHALQTFERAVRVGDWDTLLGLAPPNRRHNITAKTIEERMQHGTLRARTATALRALKKSVPNANGDARIMITSGPHSATLVRVPQTGTKARWYVDDLK